MRVHAAGVALLAATLAAAGCARSEWIEVACREDAPGGESVVMLFAPGGRGYTVQEGQVDGFTYRLDQRYHPARIDLRPAGDSAALRRGIARFVGDGEVRLLLAAPGEPRPPAFTPTEPGIACGRPATR
jgi:hypothetical protein